MRLDVSRNDSTVPLSPKLAKDCLRWGEVLGDSLGFTFYPDLGNDVFADLRIDHLQLTSLP